MRVRRSGLVRLRDERGATVAIVGITLICLLGMLVLTFDLGRGVAIKRNMVNAADAAALAAARECGLAKGPGAARTAADQLVNENNAAASVIGFDVDDELQCSGLSSAGKHQVTVSVRVPQEYFFAQIFGFDAGAVSASATAEWIPGVANPVPLKLDQLKVDDCVTGHQPGYTCYFTFDNSASQTGSQRGILNFPEGWPIQGRDTNPMNCTSNKGGANDLINYIRQMGQTSSSSFFPVLWTDAAGNPEATYACAEGGEVAKVVDEIVDWVNSVPDAGTTMVFFPVVACNGGSFPGPGPCYPWMQTSGRESYPVVDFVGMRVVHAWKGQDAKNQAGCDFTSGKGNGKVSSDVFCVELAVASPTDKPLAGGTKVLLVD
jgi:hypothetical protein